MEVLMYETFPLKLVHPEVSPLRSIENFNQPPVATMYRVHGIILA